MLSQGGVSERIQFLRRSIAAIEARNGTQTAPARPQRRSENLSRDPFERLLDGLARGSLREAVPALPRDMAAAAGFAFALALRCAVARPNASLVWIAEDMAVRETGLPYGRGFEIFGLDPKRLVLVRTRRPRDTLWAMEEALKNKAAAAVVAETWMAPKTYDLKISRRLLLAARQGKGAGLLLLPRAAGEATRLTSAAQIRFEISSPPIPRASAGVSAARRLPLPGPLAWRLRIAKARADLFGGTSDVDPLRWRDILFDHEKAVFCHAFPQRVSAAFADRPDLEAKAQRSA
jgi:protein ImuA